MGALTIVKPVERRLATESKDVMDRQLRVISVVKGLPEDVQACVDDCWHAYEAAAIEAGVKPVRHKELRGVLNRVWASSDFVTKLCIRHPEMLSELMTSGDLFIDYQSNAYQDKIRLALAGVNDEIGLCEVLRLQRQREMLRIAWRDLAGWAGLTETVFSLSKLAEASLSNALDLLHRWLCDEYGTPVGQRSGESQSLVVLGMGKLGAHELNFSSDVDLVFAYPEEGETQGRRVSISNEEFFTKLGRRLIHAIDATTAQGFVFRVDMRLRPFGDSGPLVMSFDAIEEYYQSHGRDWERYAMVKARPVVGDPSVANALMSKLRPFVYRRYLDFGAFEALRDMKALIAQQVSRKGMENNVKLGPGGIREVEFIGQLFQLIRGGREPALQERRILVVLRILAERAYLPQYVTDQLAKAYIFLRHTENRLQAFGDRQTHRLPADELEQMRLAVAMGYDSWPSFRAALTNAMASVHSHFEQVFAAPQTEYGPTDQQSGLADVWLATGGQEQACELLRSAGFVEPDEVLRLLAPLRDGASYRALTQHGRERFDRFMPLLLGAVAVTAQPLLTLKRLIRVVESIGRRSAYFALLVEHPMALSQLAKLCAASPWISDFVAQHPLLLDELLDARTLYAPLERGALEQELKGALQSIGGDDLEQQMETLRNFTQSNLLRVAAADVFNVAPLMVVSDYLTEIAEVALGEVLAHAWQQLTHRHGVPLCKRGEHFESPGFAIIGYGKLGGIELGYGSDLDLVFLHDSEGDQELTAGPKRIDNAVFFARLGQRIIHMLSTRTPSGVLYDVDTRLRPSGASGLLVSSLASFADYQRHDAWTWEHQALVRARFIAGSEHIAEVFNRIRKEVLARKRDPVVLQQEVRDMRERMRSELGSRRAKAFDLKQDAGGIADIEFMVQYCVLRWAAHYPELLRWTDNIRLLDTLSDSGLMAAADATFLSDSYRAYRAEVHRLTLQEAPAKLSSEQFKAQRAEVVRIWRALMETPPR